MPNRLGPPGGGNNSLSLRLGQAIILTRSDRPSVVSLTGHQSCRVAVLPFLRFRIEFRLSGGPLWRSNPTARARKGRVMAHRLQTAKGAFLKCDVAGGRRRCYLDGPSRRGEPWH